MNVQATTPEIDAGTLLPGAQFIDAYVVAVDGAALDARHAAEKMLSRGPRWIDTLMAGRPILFLSDRSASDLTAGSTVKSS